MYVYRSEDSFKKTLSLMNVRPLRPYLTNEFFVLSCQCCGLLTAPSLHSTKCYKVPQKCHKVPQSATKCHKVPQSATKSLKSVVRSPSSPHSCITFHIHVW